MTSFVKHTFSIVGAVLLAMLLYQLFFGVDNSAIKFASDAVETPISFYYYAYAFQPSAHILDDITKDFNATNYKVSNTAVLHDSYGSAYLDHNTDNTSSIASYSTGWY